MYSESYDAPEVTSFEPSSAYTTPDTAPSSVDTEQLTLSGDDTIPTSLASSLETESFPSASSGDLTPAGSIEPSAESSSQSPSNSSAPSEVSTTPGPEGTESSGRTGPPQPSLSGSDLSSEPCCSASPSPSVYGAPSSSSTRVISSSLATSEPASERPGGTSPSTPDPPTTHCTIPPSPPSSTNTISDSSDREPPSPSPTERRNAASPEVTDAPACGSVGSSSSPDSSTSLAPGRTVPISDNAPINGTTTSSSKTRPTGNSLIAGGIEESCTGEGEDCPEDPSLSLPTGRGNLISDQNTTGVDNAAGDSTDTADPPLRGTSNSESPTEKHSEPTRTGDPEHSPRLESSSDMDSRLTAVTIIAALEGLALLLVLGYYATSLRKRWAKRQEATRLAKAEGWSSMDEKTGRTEARFAALGMGGTGRNIASAARTRARASPVPYTEFPVASSSRHRTLYRHQSYTSHDTGSYSQESTNADDPFRDGAGVVPTTNYRDGAVQTGHPTAPSTHTTNLTPITFRRSLTESQIPKAQSHRSSLSTFDTSREAYTRDPFDMEYNPMEADRPFGYRARSFTSPDDDLYPSGPENSEVASSILRGQESSRPMSPSSVRPTSALHNPFITGEG